VADASPAQIRAWADSIPFLQREIDEVLYQQSLAKEFAAILEYQLPLESRRPDAVFLTRSSVVVVELKGKLEPSQADLDQASAYARDLRCYHRDCAGRDVIPILVPTRATGYQEFRDGVHVAGPNALDELLGRLTCNDTLEPLDRHRFLDDGAYCPLPSLITAARELFQTGDLRKIRRAEAETGPTVEAIGRIIHDAAKTRSRHLILVTGVPGAGKTLVGLQTVHAHYLDDLAVPRADGSKMIPAVFLSGNGPLVEVLQYELKGAGGGGRTFVRGVKEYVRTYSRTSSPVPPEHVLVFDEAQRAYDAETVASKHKRDHKTGLLRSEPELFVDFAERIPDWCVVVGLIGTGQEIHTGEEGGLVQWRRAIEQSGKASEWSVHVPLNVASVFRNTTRPIEVMDELNLDTELRQHSATDLHKFVAGLLEVRNISELGRLADALESGGFHLRITRSLEQGRTYLWERYAENTEARFGLLASSKDKFLETIGIPNGFQATKQVRIGPWYGDSQESERSCRRLTSCVTEFGSQGLELDSTLLAWGTDLMLRDGRWSNDRARGYKRGANVRDPFQLRLNAYRVLLTRGRDACVVFVPETSELDETFTYLKDSGFKQLR
jgi:hypothetical protein